MIKNIYNIFEAAEYTGMSIAWFRKMVTQKRIGYVTPGGAKRILFRKEDLDAILNSGYHKPVARRLRANETAKTEGQNGVLDTTVAPVDEKENVPVRRRNVQRSQEQHPVDLGSDRIGIQEFDDSNTTFAQTLRRLRKVGIPAG